MVQTGFFLHDSVGPGHRPANRREDVIAVKQHLNDLGLYEPPPEGLSDDIDAGFDAAIKRFQSENGLQIDGRLEPGGETERNLIATLSDGEPDKPVTANELSLGSRVGARGANNAEDVIKIKQALNALGRLPLDRTRRPPPFIDTKTVEAIRAVQRDLGLYDDGYIGPDGETIRAFRDVFAERARGRPGTRPGETKVAAAKPLPEGETSRARRNIFPEKPRGRSGTRPGETEVAVLPLALAGPLMVTGFRILAPHALRALGQIGLAAAAGQAAIDAGKRKNQSESNDDREEDANRDSTPPLEPTPPFPGDPIEPNEPEEFPARPLTFPSRTEFPIPDDPAMLIEIFPDQSEEFSLPFILENSRGKQSTQDEITDSRSIADEIIAEEGLKVVHTHGGRDQDGNDKKEAYIKNRITNGRVGSNRTDLTLKNPETNRELHINTVDTVADNATPSRREYRAAVRIIFNLKHGHILVLLPKSGEGHVPKRKAFKEFIRGLIKELDKDAPKIDPRDKTAAKDLWHLFKPPG